MPASRNTEVYFAIPSANPDNCRKYLPAWREMGYKVAVLQDHQKVDVPADIVVQYGDYRGWSASVNALCLEIVPKTAAIVVSGGDDMLPDPNYNASQLAAQFLERFPDTFGVMQPHGDDFMDSTQYCGSPWLGRNWFTKMYNGKGGLSSAYRHMFADDELFWVSGCWNVRWSRPDLFQRHEHFLRTKQPPPAYWQRNAAEAEFHDAQMFVMRSTLQFPYHQPLTPVPGHSFNWSFFEKNYQQRGERRWSQLLLDHQVAVAEVPMTKALDACSRQGKRRVFLFGAGRHTHKLLRVLCTPPVPILGIIDDNPALRGTRLWNFPVLSVQDAVALKPDAVILSSDTAEDQLALAAAPLAAQGAEIIRLYAPVTSTNSVPSAA